MAQTMASTGNWGKGTSWEDIGNYIWGLTVNKEGKFDVEQLSQSGKLGFGNNEQINESL